MTTRAGGDEATFLHLNRSGRWLDFRWVGLELDEDGALRLASLPRVDRALPAAVRSRPEPGGPSGVAVAPDGSIYFSDPASHRVWRIDGCDGVLAPVPCLGGEGQDPTELRAPRGLLFHPIRRSLFVVDSGNGRIQIFASETFQLVGIWGGAGTAPGQLMDPWALAADAEGSVYVVDHGNQRVQKFDTWGHVSSAFWDHARAAGVTEPAGVAVGELDGGPRVYILDAARRCVVVVDADGVAVLDGAGHPVVFGADHLVRPLAMLATPDAVYVGDNGRRRLLKFTPAGVFVGEAVGYEASVAALAAHGPDLLVQAGESEAPIRLPAHGGYVTRGFLVGGPFENPSARSEQWHRLKSRLAPLAADSHAQLFLFTSSTSAPPDGLPRVDAPPDTPPPWSDASVDLATFVSRHASQGRPLRQWCRVALDSPECLIPGDPMDIVWVGAALGGEGASSPSLSQMRLDFDYQTYLDNLPAVYQQDTSSRRFLARLLPLLTSLFEETEGRIAALPRLFDPAATPTSFEAWLAAWLGLSLDEAWDDDRRRRTIASAFAMAGRRGTPDGLREAVKVFAGVDVHIDEPIAHASWWTLPADDGAAEGQARMSVLGFTTMLVSAEPQGAVVGTTAVLDQSHLIGQDDFGEPPFADIAHRFGVLCYREGSGSDRALEQVRAVLDREKPAHTAYHLCVVEPRLRIGFQARLGIDTIVGGAPLPTALTGLPVDGGVFVLAGDPAGRIGTTSRIGKTVRLGERAVNARQGA